MAEPLTTPGMIKPGSGQKIIRTNSLNAAIELAGLELGITLVPEGKYLVRHGFKIRKSGVNVSEEIFLTMANYQKLPPLLRKFETRLTAYL